MTGSLKSGSAPFSRVAIVGVGLIGGSIAAGLKQRAPTTRIIGVGRSASKLQSAVARGWLDEVTEETRQAASKSDLVIFCTPVDRIVAGVHEAALASQPGTLLTDVGSVKGEICRELMTGLPDKIEFLGGHPLAGSEKTGYEFSDPNLYAGRVCVLTPHARNSPQQVARLKQFWELLGARVLQMSPEVHDKALAETSHLPHLVASVMASILADENRPLTATGFRDTTRIAAGDADLWTAILLQNSTAVLDRLEHFDRIVQDFRDALHRRDATTLRHLLEVGKLNRDALSKVSTEAAAPSIETS